jgi:hypothetical protein
MRKRSKPTKPSGRCAVCQHPERLRIEMLLAGGAAKKAVGEKFGVHKDAAWRHWTNHVDAETRASYLAGPVKLAELAERAAAEGLSVLDYLHCIRSLLLHQFSAATEAGDRHGTSALAGRLLEALRDIARYSGELGKLAQEGGVTNTTINNNIILTSPLFIDLQSTLIRVLQPYPQARAAVIGALRDLDARAAAGSSPPLIEGDSHAA